MYVGDLVDRIMQYESGELEYTEEIKLFQELINTGLAWKLQGHYGRVARDLISDGHCQMPVAEGDSNVVS